MQALLSLNLHLNLTLANRYRQYGHRRRHRKTNMAVSHPNSINNIINKAAGTRRKSMVSEKESERGSVNTSVSASSLRSNNSDSLHSLRSLNNSDNLSNSESLRSRCSIRSLSSNDNLSRLSSRDDHSSLRRNSHHGNREASKVHRLSRLSSLSRPIGRYRRAIARRTILSLTSTTPLVKVQYNTRR